MMPACACVYVFETTPNGEKKQNKKQNDDRSGARETFVQRPAAEQKSPSVFGSPD